VFIIYVQNVYHSDEHMHSNDYVTTQSLHDDGVVQHQQPSLPQQTFIQLLYIMDLQTDTSDTVVHRIQILRIGWPHLWGMNSGVFICSNVTVSRAPCDFIDVNSTSLGNGCT